MYFKLIRSRLPGPEASLTQSGLGGSLVTRGREPRHAWEGARHAWEGAPPHSSQQNPPGMASTPYTLALCRAVLFLLKLTKGYRCHSVTHDKCNAYITGTPTTPVPAPKGRARVQLVNINVGMVRGHQSCPFMQNSDQKTKQYPGKFRERRCLCEASQFPAMVGFASRCMSCQRMSDVARILDQSRNPRVW